VIRLPFTRFGTPERLSTRPMPTTRFFESENVLNDFCNNVRCTGTDHEPRRFLVLRSEGTSLFAHSLRTVSTRRSESRRSELTSHAGSGFARFARKRACGTGLTRAKARAVFRRNESPPRTLLRAPLCRARTATKGGTLSRLVRTPGRLQLART